LQRHKKGKYAVNSSNKLNRNRFGSFQDMRTDGHATCGTYVHYVDSAQRTEFVQVYLLPCSISCRSRWPCGLRPLACRDCGFESRRRQIYLSVVITVRWSKSLHRADHSSRGVLPTVVCLSVIVKSGY